MEYAPLDLPDNPQLLRNLAHFARALRVAGLPAGSGRVMDAARALASVGFTDRDTFFYATRACFCTRPEHLPIFAQIFRLYWRDPRYMEHMMSLMLPAIRGVAEQRQAKPAEKRAAESLLDGITPEAPDIKGEDRPRDTEIEIDASLTMSREERLRSLDFEQMSVAEMAEARRILARMSLPVPPLLTRRYAADANGPKPDWRRSLRQAMRHGGEMQGFARKARRERMPALICLCDISGSMSAYSRAVLHFLHALSNAKGAGWSKVYGFTFGTRLTNITRHLRGRDVDAALAAAGAEAQDWEGGTRIGYCIDRFNRDWSRRVMGQGAIVLLITDGLDRDDPELLSSAMQRLSLSSKRLIWINPLLRWEGFAPKAAGIRAILPHVDMFRAGHNIAALQGLAEALNARGDFNEKARLARMLSDAAS